MAMYLTEDQRTKGTAAYQQQVGRHLTRRDFMKGVLGASVVLPIGAAAYFGYRKLEGRPVQAALIGAGDEGGVLVGQINPEYLEIVAVSDIRPSNKKRIFDGDKPPEPPRKPSPLWRRGLKRVYGEPAAKNIKVYDNYKELLERKDIQAVIIALPLNLHYQATVDALKAGKHVLCEKLMAWNVEQCKKMIRAARDADRILSIGHQRHYSLLYAQALELINAGELGDIKHIRAMWHRNNSWPLLDKFGNPMLDPETKQPMIRDGWRPEIKAEDLEALDNKTKQYGFKSVEELIRWRLYKDTGGGLMAELGSHQLDACSIFLGKVKPLAVSGVGGKYFYHDDREVEDHVFCTFEFPGKTYWKDEAKGEVGDRNDIVVVTYSSINTSVEPYGECLMGTRGTMVIEEEGRAMLFPQVPPGGAAPATTLSVSKAGGGQPVADSSSTAGGAVYEQKGKDSLAAPPSRGYREEMEDFAYCVRMWETGEKEDTNRPKDEKGRPLPRCHGTVAMADAVIALTANLAMRGRKANGHRPERIDFKHDWFLPDSNEVPDAEMVARTL
ncbi:MAG: Gfo/Idh/MocA family oxidoreductase [Gemmataceae bacterium]|nr:Gfo/Idh/MocA family oxidoreductase [Gemmataceae bacterium]